MTSKQDYDRGRNAGIQYMEKVMQRLRAVAKGYRARSRLPAEAARTCSGCARWVRGGDSCQWGHCVGPRTGEMAPLEFAPLTEPWMRAELPIGISDRIKAYVITSEGFGCVNFLPAAKIDAK